MVKGTLGSGTIGPWDGGDDGPVNNRTLGQSCSGQLGNTKRPWDNGQSDSGPWVNGQWDVGTMEMGEQAKGDFWKLGQRCKEAMGQWDIGQWEHNVMLTFPRSGLMLASLSAKLFMALGTCFQKSDCPGHFTTRAFVSNAWASYRICAEAASQCQESDGRHNQEV